MNRRHARTPAACAGFLMTLLVLVVAFISWPSRAGNIFRWDFDTPTNYVYNANLIEVAGSQARLILQEEELADASFAEYTNAVLRKDLRLDRAAILGLSGAPGTYAPVGSFVSRILDGGLANQWQRLAVSASFEPYVVDPDVIAYYRFDGNWTDDISGGNGSPSGSPAPSFSVDAQIGSASARFDGLSGKTRLTGSGLVFGRSTISLAFWVKIDDYGNFRGIVAGLGSTQFRIRQRTTSEKVLEWRCITTGGSMAFSAGLPENTWTHYVFVWDGRIGEDNAPKIYVNGQLNATGAALTGTFTYPGVLDFGNDGEFQTTRGLIGNIDDMLILSRVLDPSAITKLYEGQSEIFRPMSVRVRSGPDPATLLTRDFVGDDGSTNSSYSVGTRDLVAGFDFGLTDRYVQYIVEMFSNNGTTKTPFLRAIRFEGDQSEVYDYTQLDWSRGTLSQLVAQPTSGNTPHVGLTKR
ncbi:MAG: LamG domain-containing protein, partial [Verrucomicrobia bacterium]|nr:LamG domain-containing protein [Verrucomicrobiota bacterium]